MSASTPTPPAASAADAPTIRIAPTPPVGYLPAASGAREQVVLRARTPLGRAVDLMARLGTAVTLAALLVVTATALGVVDDGPMPTGAATSGR